MKKAVYNNLILGGGISGLTAGLTTRWPIFEAADVPGGICSSYYVRPESNNRLTKMPEDKEAYHFEIGGGHWIFGADNAILEFMRKFTPLKSYKRSSIVYFRKENLYVPYPIQNNLRFLDKDITKKVLEEIPNMSSDSCSTMKKWLTENFGQTLCKLFFWPFHDLYTANLYENIASQDVHKSPLDVRLIMQGAKGDTPSVGYNVTFVYPEEGLNTLVQRMVKECTIQYGKRATKIDIREKDVYFTDGSIVPYSQLVSTLSLNKMMAMTGLLVDAEPDPYNSVLVLNVGAVRGDNCPDEHWLYNPHSRSGFYRIGFYSNVDVSFLPKSSQKSNNRVSMYVERAYPGGQKPPEQQIKTYTDSIVSELQEWNFIKDVEVLDPTWIDVAYTWSWLGSKWRKKAIALLKKHDIHQIGRYGRWRFQGIVDSIKEGLFSGKQYQDLK